MMGLRRTRRLGAVLAACAATAVTFAAVAGAGQAVHETFHEEETVVFDDFCDVAGLTVVSEGVVDGRVHIVPHGRDRLPYFAFHVRGTIVYTNPANGMFVTEVSHVTDKDLKVTDNGDGTLTLLVLATGNFVVYGQDGKAIARNPGQVRFELLIDHGGTPQDPSDDVELDFLGIVKGSTGRTDDFCTAVVPALT
jgi:hypothetical protein